ncbi:alkaline phosphatase family protein [Thermoflavifilum thermophilum]|uniref:Predicted pyrophosphatase or phosphodiesterase, AlkP superfamily n=1 Tax=Thermoflavifilum thermophilum TaxID=1393122 RepID=A0A1I7NDK7_9BACT|nr:nucleotide pyrophosphatase/phosphodiesterase family protein [Thermoflavifilum thermophilum]SFV32742.1 Predicted pyrophosphatase or phosphodiesterase, AlkP superfamily [Thermoflavifilum thermophilum]
MNRVAIINISGLSVDLIRKFTPQLDTWLSGVRYAPIQASFPMLSPSMQASFLTGSWPTDHGIVGNGWYEADQALIHWQFPSGRLIQHPGIWQRMKAKYPDFRCALIGWHHYFQNSCDIVAGFKPYRMAFWPPVPQVYVKPKSLLTRLAEEWEEFRDLLYRKEMATPSRIRSEAEELQQMNERIFRTAQWVEMHEKPHLTCISLPELSYQFPVKGLETAQLGTILASVDRLCMQLISLYEAHDVQVMLLSDEVYTPVHQPVYINRLLREEGWLEVISQYGQEFLDVMESKAFAVADHQIAHVYVQDPKQARRLKAFLQQIDGVAAVWDRAEKRNRRIAHPRAGDYVVIAESGRWFAYDYWRSKEAAPYQHYAMAYAEPYGTYALLGSAPGRQSQAPSSSLQTDFPETNAHAPDTLIKAASGCVELDRNHAPLFAAAMALPECISPVDVYGFIVQALQGN